MAKGAVWVEVHYDRFDEIEQAVLARVDEALGDSAAEIQETAQAIVAVDTGRLRASITMQRVGNLIYEVFTVVEYGPYVEYGTRYMAAQPFMRPAYERNYARTLANIETAIRSVT